MYAQPITLANGECDGYVSTYCDNCGAEAHVKEAEGMDLCTDCRSEIRDNLETEWCALYDKRDAESCPKAIAAIERKMESIQQRIQELK